MPTPYERDAAGTTTGGSESLPKPVQLQTHGSDIRAYKRDDETCSSIEAGVATGPVSDPLLPTPNTSPPQGGIDTATTDHGLVVANPVTDDVEATLTHANPVDLEEQEQREKEQKKQRRTFVFVLVLMVLAVLAIVGTVSGTQTKREDSIVLKTSLPTVFLSMEPSAVPSSAPTGSLDLLLDGLPNETLVMLNIGSDTPQWKAWNWLSNHQKMTNLPEWRKTQLFAMATFYYAFEGEAWPKYVQDRWMQYDTEECNWYSNLLGWFLKGVYTPYTNDADEPIQGSPCNELGALRSWFCRTIASQENRRFL